MIHPSEYTFGYSDLRLLKRLDKQRPSVKIGNLNAAAEKQQ